MSETNAIKTILFVENDPVSLAMYQNRLQREGFYVKTATDGLAALKILSGPVPDIIVLDLMLPRFSGSEVFKFIRTDSRLRTLPVVIFSNATMSEWPHDIAVGATQCLLKSDCTFPTLLQTIQDLLAAVAAGAIPTPEISPANKPPASEAPAKPGVSVAPAPTAPPPAAPVIKGPADFVKSILAEVPRLREHCLAYIKAPASDAGKQHLSRLNERIHEISRIASEMGCVYVAQLTKAFAALLAEITVKTSWMTPSVLQTIAQTVDCLNYLLEHIDATPANPNLNAAVLAVDDDPICNRVMVTTLKRANFEITSMESPLAALQLLQSSRFDVILLDVNMPDLTGFELCNKLRQLSHCKTTPVIFITAFNNFENRKQSVLSGGDDFITKPVSPLELALKVTMHLLKSRVQRGNAPVIEPPKPADLSRNMPPSVPALQPAQAGISGTDTTQSRTVPVPTTESATTAGSDRVSAGDSPSIDLPSARTPETSIEPAPVNRMERFEKIEPVPAIAQSETVSASVPEPAGAQAAEPFIAAATHQEFQPTTVALTENAPVSVEPSNVSHAAPTPASEPQITGLANASSFMTHPETESTNPGGPSDPFAGNAPFQAEPVAGISSPEIILSSVMPAEEPQLAPPPAANLSTSMTESVNSADTPPFGKTETTIDSFELAGIPDIFQSSVPSRPVASSQPETMDAAITPTPFSEPVSVDLPTVNEAAGEPFSTAITNDPADEIPAPIEPTALEIEIPLFTGASPATTESGNSESQSIEVPAEPAGDVFATAITREDTSPAGASMPAESNLAPVADNTVFVGISLSDTESSREPVPSTSTPLPPGNLFATEADQDVFQIAAPSTPDPTSFTQPESPMAGTAPSTESSPPNLPAADIFIPELPQLATHSNPLPQPPSVNVEAENSVLSLPSPEFAADVANTTVAVPPDEALPAESSLAEITNDSGLPAISQPSMAVPISIAPTTEPGTTEITSDGVPTAGNPTGELKSCAQPIDSTAVSSLVETPATTDTVTSDSSPAEAEKPVVTPPSAADFLTQAPSEFAHAVSLPTAENVPEKPTAQIFPEDPACASAASDASSQSAAVSQTPDQVFDTIVEEVARLMFGDDDLSEMNLRLVRRALERQNILKLLRDLKA